MTFRVALSLCQIADKNRSQNRNIEQKRVAMIKLGTEAMEYVSSRVINTFEITNMVLKV